MTDHKEVEEQTSFKLNKFKNINGEGVIATQFDPNGNKIKVLCGNDKLMDHYAIDLDFNSFRLNMQSLEKEGKTVVCLVVNEEPRLLIALEEAHVTKPEALGVVTYLRDVMKMDVAMITGDN